MSTFRTEVVSVIIEPHPNADRLEIACIGEFKSIVGKGTFKTGDLAAYIQEGSLVPKEILEEMNLVGKLGGSQRNRVKPAKLRGVLSEGLCYPAREGWQIGDDVSHELGIEKWDPNTVSPHAIRVPPNGTYNAGPLRTVKYDIENFKRYPNLIKEGAEVVITEKIHGTFCGVGFMLDGQAHPEFGHVMPFSKGLGRKGIVYKPDMEENQEVLYVRAAKMLEKKLTQGIVKLINAGNLGSPFISMINCNNIFIMGEIFGDGIQDLGYASEDMSFRCFDVAIRPHASPNHLIYMDEDVLQDFCDTFDIDRVPVLYKGGFNKNILKDLTDGYETVSGEAAHIREGVVVRTAEFRQDYRIGRVQLKSVSEDYLTRKDGTEYN